MKTNIIATTNSLENQNISKKNTEYIRLYMVKVGRAVVVKDSIENKENLFPMLKQHLNKSFDK